MISPPRLFRDRRPPEWARLILEELEQRWLPSHYVVNSTLDVLGDTVPGQVTLRDVLTAINNQAASGQAAAGSASNTITFSIPGSGPQTIHVGSSGQGALPSVTHQVFLDGWSQGGVSYNGSPLIVLDGSSAGTLANGLTLAPGSSHSTVRGLDVVGFSSEGLVLHGSSHDLLAGNYVGIDAQGDVSSSTRNGASGVQIEMNATANTVGGTTPGAANVISGNLFGIFFTGSGPPSQLVPARNVVLGNFIGTDIHGTGRIGNTIDGVFMQVGATANTIGGTFAGAANVISGNGFNGVRILTNTVSRNVIVGNLIGTDIHGTAQLGNGMDGVVIQNGATANTVGGAASGAVNVISGNGRYGVYLNGSGTSKNVVLGNRIGTDVHGSAALGNTLDGVRITNGATANTVGGKVTGAANVISGNQRDGVYLYGSGTSGNVVLGNLIGTDISGTASIANNSGVRIALATANTIGGTAPGAGNVISGNRDAGVILLGEASDNVVLGNRIGTDISGTARLGNPGVGVLIEDATANTVGGTVPGAANVISANEFGVEFSGFAPPDPRVATRNVVLGNFIGTDIHGTSGLGNSMDGVLIQAGATANTVGGRAAGAANVISANGNDGVRIVTGGASRNVVLGNRIGTDRSGTGQLGNTLDGVAIGQGAGSNTVGGAVSGALNVISGNGRFGVNLYGTGTSNNVVLGNRIGTDVHGSAALGNALDGVTIANGATANVVGGTVAGDANVISGNQRDGVYLNGSRTSGNVVLGNLIGTNVHGTAKLGNNSGVLVAAATANTIGGTAMGAGNVISGNGGHGVDLESGASGNVVLGNRIGTDRSGTARLGNAGYGLLIGDATANTVGGTALGAANVISANEFGVVSSGFSQPSPLVPSENVLLGNFIGTDIHGTRALGNTMDGVLMQSGATANTVGGTTAGAANVISGNGGYGVVFDGSTTSGNLVIGSLLGVARNGKTPLRNALGDGAFWSGATANSVTGNVLLVHGTQDPFLSSGATGNMVAGNTDVRG